MSKGNTETETLRPWLLNIHARAPHCPVIIVGTHIDRLPRGNESLKHIQMKTCVCVKIYQDGNSDQWRIQDFPDRTLTAGHNLAKFSGKLLENKENRGKASCVSCAPTLLDS